MRPWAKGLESTAVPNGMADGSLNTCSWGKNPARHSTAMSASFPKVSASCHLALVSVFCECMTDMATTSTSAVNVTGSAGMSVPKNVATAMA